MTPKKLDVGGRQVQEQQQRQRIVSVGADVGVEDQPARSLGGGARIDQAIVAVGLEAAQQESSLGIRELHLLGAVRDSDVPEAVARVLGGPEVGLRRQLALFAHGLVLAQGRAPATRLDGLIASSPWPSSFTHMIDAGRDVTLVTKHRIPEPASGVGCG
ncbi:MAG: hypothetical protein QM765_11140 [Myxococcales bacterium]